MLNVKKHTLRKGYLAYLFVLLFAFHFVNNVFCVHSHLIDGEMVTHSHLFWTSPTEHQHSAEQLTLIQQSNYVLTTTENVLFHSPLTLYQVLLAHFSTPKDYLAVYVADSRNVGLRAPPAFA